MACRVTPDLFHDLLADLLLISLIVSRETLSDLCELNDFLMGGLMGPGEIELESNGEQVINLDATVAMIGGVTPPASEHTLDHSVARRVILWPSLQSKQGVEDKVASWTSKEKLGQLSAAFDFFLRQWKHLTERRPS